MMNTIAFRLLALLPLVAAQLTLYDVSLSPEQTSGPYANAAVLVSAIVQGAGTLKATPTSVDASGFTLYVAVQELTALPVVNLDGISTVVLPTPTPITFEFRADASRAFYEYESAVSTAGLQAEVGVAINCTHNVDSDTSVEDGTIECAAEIGFHGEEPNLTVGTTVAATVTGQPVAFATITDVLSEATPAPSNGTGDGEEEDVDEDGMGARNAVVGAAMLGAAILSGIALA